MCVVPMSHGVQFITCVIGLSLVIAAMVGVRKLSRRAIQIVGATVIALMVAGSVYAGTSGPVKPQAPILTGCAMHCAAVAAGAESWWTACLIYLCCCS